MAHAHATCVILADRHPVLLRTLKNILEPECEVVGMVDNAISLIDALDAQKPDALVMEISMRNQSGESLARHLLRRYPQVPVVVLGDEDDPALIDEALGFGAAGYVTKQQAATDLPRAVREAIQGRSSQMKGNQ